MLILIDINIDWYWLILIEIDIDWSGDLHTPKQVIVS